MDAANVRSSPSAISTTPATRPDGPGGRLAKLGNEIPARHSPIMPRVFTDLQRRDREERRASQSFRSNSLRIFAPLRSLR